MTMPTRRGKTLLPGHGLMYEGHAMYGKHGRCWCGAVSEQEYDSAAARRRWHNEHKDSVRKAAQR
jgi:hypothetical protein